MNDADKFLAEVKARSAAATPTRSTRCPRRGRTGGMGKVTRSYLDAPEYPEVRALVAPQFDGSEFKIGVWFTTPNHLLGGLAPCTYLELGRGEKLLKLVKSQLAGNWP